MTHAELHVAKSDVMMGIAALLWAAERFPAHEAHLRDSARVARLALDRLVRAHKTEVRYG